MEVFDDIGQGCLNECSMEVFDDTRQGCLNEYSGSI